MLMVFLAATTAVPDAPPAKADPPPCAVRLIMISKSAEPSAAAPQARKLPFEVPRKGPAVLTPKCGAAPEEKSSDYPMA